MEPGEACASGRSAPKFTIIAAAMKKAKPLPHRNRRRSARYRAKLKAKNRRVRLRQSKGERSRP